MADKRLVIFTDIGDTIIDQGTELRNEAHVVYHAECIPGAKQTMLSLYEQGYPIVMVADGMTRSFENTMRENGLSHIFSAWVISEAVGVDKPDARMFSAAMERMGLTEADKPRIIMVGNNLSRDVLGANRFGITSVHLSWSPRYPAVPSCPQEEPDYRISLPEELLPLVEKLEAKLRQEGR